MDNFYKRKINITKKLISATFLNTVLIVLLFNFNTKQQDLDKYFVICYNDY